MNEIRRTALESAVLMRLEAGPEQVPSVVALAREFEHYLRNGHEDASTRMNNANGVLVSEEPCTDCARTQDPEPATLCPCGHRACTERRSW